MSGKPRPRTSGPTRPPRSSRTTLTTQDNRPGSSKTQRPHASSIPIDTKYLKKEFRMTVPRPRYAYFTLVMCGDEYVKGALTLAWSLRQQNTKHELVVMVTSDVSVDALKVLRKLYNRVIRVGYIRTKVKSTLRGKAYRDENQWINYSLTKARMLKYTEYDKAMWMDADSLVLQNIDHLFDLPAPAGVCSSIKDHDYWHGKHISEDLIQSSIDNNYGVHGCVMLLEPRLDHYFMASSQPVIGDRKTFMGPDEFFFTELYKSRWHHIHVRYGCTRWHMERLGAVPHTIHYGGAKPWEDGDRIQEWDGLWHWRTAADQMCRERPAFSVLFKKERPKSTLNLLRLITDHS